MNYISKILLFTFLTVGAFLSAAEPPAPPGPGGGDGGGVVGPGAPASPIDAYVYVLGIVAVLFIAYYTKKASKKLA